MSDINVSREHGMNVADARAATDHMAQELKERFDLDLGWHGEVLQFARSGLTGTMEIDAKKVTLNIRLGFFLSALKSSIEGEIHRFFDENFPA